MSGMCSAPMYLGRNKYGRCGNPATFVFGNEDEPFPVEVCGKHLASEIARYPIPSAQSTRFTVVPYNPNVEKLG